MHSYIYTPSPDYINNLKFNYLETWSFQRGQEFDERRKASLLEYNELNRRKQGIDASNAIDKARLTTFIEGLNCQQKLIVENGRFHPKSQKINTFISTEPEAERLRSILRTEIFDVPIWMCAPFYRDAIVFYNGNNEIVSTLNVCLSCEYMQTDSFHFINADAKTYKLLYDFFREIGHMVEETSNRR